MRCSTFNPFPGVSALALLLAATLPAPAAVALPNGGRVEKVDFERHVMGLFGRAGCNSGSCHGSFQGKGGFREWVESGAAHASILAAFRRAS